MVIALHVVYQSRAARGGGTFAGGSTPSLRYAVPGGVRGVPCETVSYARRATAFHVLYLALALGGLGAARLGLAGNSVGTSHIVCRWQMAALSCWRTDKSFCNRPVAGLVLHRPLYQQSEC